MKNTVGLVRVGQPVTFTIDRKGHMLTIKTTSVPTEKLAQKRLQRNPFFIGVSLDNYDAVTALEGEVQGVRIIKMNKDSVAIQSGLLKGDVITEINNQRIKNLTDFNNAMKQAKGDLLVKVYRSPGSLYIVMK